MLRIIPTPKNKKILYTIPGNWWEDVFKDEYYAYAGGIYFEYIENDILRFEFFYVLGKISILEGPFSSECTPEMMEAILCCSVSLDELWEWIDKIPFKIVKCLDANDSSIKGIWKMEDFYIRMKEYNYNQISNKNYYEFLVYTTTIRFMPYSWGKVKIEILNNETDKIYWITLCLLKYQKQLNQQ